MEGLERFQSGDYLYARLSNDSKSYVIFTVYLNNIGTLSLHPQNSSYSDWYHAGLSNPTHINDWIERIDEQSIRMATSEEIKEHRDVADKHGWKISSDGRICIPNN